MSEGTPTAANAQSTAGEEGRGEGGRDGKTRERGGNTPHKTKEGKKREGYNHLRAGERAAWRGITTTEEGHTARDSVKEN